MHLHFQEALLNVLMLWILTAPHEFAHAWVGTKLGDPTPALDGRVTLNPLAHVDWIGTAALPFLTSLFGGGFIGWGRPVRSDISKLRGGINGLALVAMAGPASNVVMAVIMGLIALGCRHAAPALAQFAVNTTFLSLYLGILNMLPIPPLDGSKLLLVARIPMWLYMEISRVGFMLLILAVSVSDIGRWMSQWAYWGTAAILGRLG